MRRLILQRGYITLINIFYLSIWALGQDISTLPLFSFTDLEGKILSTEKFRNNRPLIIFYYEPTCSHCEQQAEWVASNIDKFEEVDLLWVAWEPTNAIPEFRSRFFPQAENVYYVIDNDTAFDNLFGFSQIPTVFVYDSEDLLVKKFKKEAKAEKLLKALGLSDL